MSKSAHRQIGKLANWRTGKLANQHKQIPPAPLLPRSPASPCHLVTLSPYHLVTYLLLLLAFILRFWNLGTQSLWYDEAFCWWMAVDIPLPKTLALSLREIVPPLNYLLLRAWIPLAGASEFALRAPSAFLGILGVAAAARIVWRLTRQRAGVIAALALCAVAPPLVWAAREVRLYGLAIGFTLLSSMALVETLFGPPAQRRRWAWLWGATTLAALYTLILSAFWLIGQGVFALLILFFSQRIRRNWVASLDWLKTMFAPGLPVVGVFLPWVSAALTSVGRNSGYWPGHLPVTAFFKTALRGITTGKFLPEPLAIYIGGGIVGFAILTLFAYTKPWQIKQAQSWVGIYALCYAIPSLAILSIIYRNIPKWAPRHALIFAPAPFLMLALAWGTIPLPRDTTSHLPSPVSCILYPVSRLHLTFLSLGTLITTFPLLWANANLFANPAYMHEDWRGAAAYVQEHRQPGDVIIVETGSVFPAWSYYAGTEGMLPLPQDELLDVNHVLHYSNTALLLNAQLQTASHVWLVNWIGDVTDPTDIVPTLLDDIGTEVIAPTFYNLSLRRFTLNQAPDFPTIPDATLTHVELLPDLTLWGYRLPTTLPADTSLDLRMWWTIQSPAAHTNHLYHVVTRIYDSTGEEWLWHDELLGGGSYRPERWPAHTPILGRYSLTLPPGIPPGTYTAHLTLYEGEATQTYTLDTFHITWPTAPPDIPEGMAPVASPPSSFLQLLAVGLDRPDATFCNTLNGHLFWELGEKTPTFQEKPGFDEYRARVSLGAEYVDVALFPEDVAQAWHAGDRFLTKFRLPISCRALDTTAPLLITLLDPEGNPIEAAWTGPEAQIKTGRQFTLPGGLTLSDAHAGADVARLRGYRLDPATLRANQPFTATLYWEALHDQDTPYSVFIHITPPGTPGPVIAQHDGWPGLGKRATYTWVPGEIVADPHPLPALPPGEYALRVGVYGPDGVRLPLTSTTHTAIDNALVIPFTLKK